MTNFKAGTVCIDTSQRDCPVVLFIKINRDDPRYALVVGLQSLEVYNVPPEELEIYTLADELLAYARKVETDE